MPCRARAQLPCREAGKLPGAGDQSPGADQSIRGSERLRNADADLAIVADRTGVERQEGVLLRILWDGLMCRRASFHEARLVLENGFDQLVDQIIGEIGSADGEIVHP